MRHEGKTVKVREKEHQRKETESSFSFEIRRPNSLELFSYSILFAASSVAENSFRFDSLCGHQVWESSSCKGSDTEKDCVSLFVVTLIFIPFESEKRDGWEKGSLCHMFFDDTLTFPSYSLKRKKCLCYHFFSLVLLFLWMTLPPKSSTVSHFPFDVTLDVPFIRCPSSRFLLSFSLF